MSEAMIQRSIDNALIAVGRFIMAWGQLEIALTYNTELLNPAEVGPDINPDSTARNLAGLTSWWRNAYTKAGGKKHKDADTLVKDIKQAGLTRNSVAHGFHAIAAFPDGETFAVSCMVQYARNRLTRSGLPQANFLRDDLTRLTDEIYGLRARLETLTRQTIE